MCIYEGLNMGIKINLQMKSTLNSRLSKKKCQISYTQNIINLQYILNLLNNTCNEFKITQFPQYSMNINPTYINNSDLFLRASRLLTVYHIISYGVTSYIYSTEQLLQNK